MRVMIMNEMVMNEMVMRVIKMVVKIMMIKVIGIGIGIGIGIIKFINVIVGLVSITPGHVKLDWLPPPKVDRVNDNSAHYQH